MTIRLTKCLFVFSLGILAIIITLNNLQDYALSLKMVKSVMEMKTILPGSKLTYRAIDQSVLHHFALITVILIEAATGILCCFGSYKMFRRLRCTANEFNRAKTTAIAGLSVGFLCWQCLFMTVGGEWFGMWMSPIDSGSIQSAFRFFITFLTVLIYVAHRDEDRPNVF